jgi:hypothetical protein
VFDKLQDFFPKHRYGKIAATVWTTWVHVHPSGHFSSTSGRLSVFDKLQDFFPKHRYGKIAATV